MNPKSTSHKSTTAASPAAADAAVADIAARLQALDAQERALEQERQQIRKSYFDQTVVAIKSNIAQLTGIGFDVVHIAKAVGLASSITRKEKKGTGPTTNDGWFRLYRTRAIQTYLTSNPELAATLDRDKVPAAEFPQHIPAADLARIDASARTKADIKCPAAVPTES